MSNSRSQSAEEVQRSAGGSVAGGVWFNHARYDSNGNVISGLAGLAGTYSYDVENRMVDNGVERYGYGAGNRRLWKKSTVSGSWAEVYLYGLGGEVLEVFRGMMGSPLQRQSYTPTQRAWFGGRLIEKLGTAMNADRLGSYEKTYPYGELQGAVGTPGEKFGTYWRDATGLDYAVNRYYSSQMGRFLSADPYVAGGGAADSGSWNRYAYVQNDPVNWTDTLGLNRDVCEDPAEAPFIAACVQRTQNGQIGPILIPRFPTMEGALLWAFAWFTGPPRSSGGGSPKQEPDPTMPKYLRVTDDCYVIGGVAERHTTYTAYSVRDKPLYGFTITEHLTGYLPRSGATLSGPPTSTFEDRQSIVLGSLSGNSVQQTVQTFTATNQTLGYTDIAVFVRGFRNAVGLPEDYGVLSIYKTSEYVKINYDYGGTFDENGRFVPNKICGR